MVLLPGIQLIQWQTLTELYKLALKKLLLGLLHMLKLKSSRLALIVFTISLLLFSVVLILQIAPAQTIQMAQVEFLLSTRLIQLIALTQLVMEHSGNPQTILSLPIVLTQMLTTIPSHALKVYSELLLTHSLKWINFGKMTSVTFVLMHRLSGQIAFQILW